MPEMFPSAAMDYVVDATPCNSEFCGQQIGLSVSNGFVWMSSQNVTNGFFSQDVTTVVLTVPVGFTFRGYSVNTLPSVAFDNAKDGLITNSELLSESRGTVVRTSEGVTLADVKDLSFSENGQVGIFALTLTALGISVCDVLYVSTQEEMFRINTRRIITTVADAKTLRNRTEVDFPRVAVSPSLMVSVDECSVTAAHNAAGPEPTAITFNNLGPEAFCISWSWIIGRTVILPTRIVHPAQAASDSAVVTTSNGTRTEVNRTTWHSSSPSEDLVKVRQPARNRFSGATLAANPLYQKVNRNGTNPGTNEVGGSTSCKGCGSQEGRRSIRERRFYTSLRSQMKLFVHEDLTAHHVSGQAKFLEQPARQLTSDGTLGRIVLEAKRKGQTLSQALVLAGLRLQRDSQQLVPVDTGSLRSSAFTRLEGGS